MTTPAPTEAELAMARKCAATCARNLGHYVMAQKIEAGDADHSPSVQSALAAIRATTEAAAALVHREYESWMESPKWKGIQVIYRVWKALRANHHLRGEQS